MTTVIFSHGQESGPWGTKIRRMAGLARGLGCEADSIDYQGIADPTRRVEKLLQECADIEDRLILVGSSMGGHVATPVPPALPICIVHGWHDDIVPVENSIRFASSCGATLHVVDGDHRLTANIDEINYYLKRFIEQLEK